jgi:Uncharacterized conserved protein
LKNINLLKGKWSFVFMTAVMFLFLMGIVPTANHKVLAAEVKTSEVAARTINVNGDGEVSVAPDIAYISFGVTTEKSSVGEAQKNNSTTMNNIIDSIKKAGVASEDIQTSNYTISPKYSYDDKTGNSTIVGYTVTSTLSVTVKNINSVGNIIDTAIINGANNSNGITFGVSDYEKYYSIALTNAISNAKVKAQAIAGCIDVKLSTPTKITENSSGVPAEYPVFYNATEKSISDIQGMSVEVGNYKVKANISLVYEY